MSARIPPAKWQAIEKRRAAGERMKDIAVAVSVSESTVRRVCEDVDAKTLLVGTPAQLLTEREVSVLQQLVSSYTIRQCPVCHRAMLVSRAVPQASCPHCAAEWVVPPAKG